MVAKLTVIFFIVLCVMVGTSLIIVPWINFGGFNWGENYFLTLLVEKTGLTVVRNTIASGWFRGAITGLGILNLLLAFWETAHFKRSVQALEAEEISRGK